MNNFETYRLRAVKVTIPRQPQVERWPTIAEMEKSCSERVWMKTLESELTPGAEAWETHCFAETGAVNDIQEISRASNLVIQLKLQLR